MSRTGASGPACHVVEVASVTTQRFSFVVVALSDSKTYSNSTITHTATPNCELSLAPNLSSGRTRGQTDSGSNPWDPSQGPRLRMTGMSTLLDRVMSQAEADAGVVSGNFRMAIGSQ